MLRPFRWLKRNLHANKIGKKDRFGENVSAHLGALRVPSIPSTAADDDPHPTAKQ
jgi:hypothetical protein